MSPWLRTPVVRLGTSAQGVGGPLVLPVAWGRAWIAVCKLSFNYLSDLQILPPALPHYTLCLMY